MIFLKRPLNRKNILQFKKNNQTGMSLIEVLIALAIFSVGILGLMPMFLYTANQSRIQRDKEVVQQLLVDWMGRLQSMTYDYDSLTQDNINNFVQNTLGQAPVAAGGDAGRGSDGPAEIETVSPNGMIYRIRFDLDDGDNSASMETDPNSPNCDLNQPLERPFKRVTIQLWWNSLGRNKNGFAIDYTMSLSRLFLRDANYIEGV